MDVPPGLDAIILKCLSKKPEGRYQTMDELVADLEKLEQGPLPDAVPEMMARSGGFNVPADYFRSSAMPAPVPASPALPKTRWPLYAVIAAVATGIGVVGVVMARGGNSTASAPPPPTTTTTPAATAPPVPTPLPSAMLAPAPSAAPAMHQVLVSVLPVDATITRDGADLGSSPVALSLADGASATLAVSRKGYKPQTVAVDTRQPKVVVKLDVLPGAWPPPGAGAGPKPKPAGGGGIRRRGGPVREALTRLRAGAGAVWSTHEAHGPPSPSDP